MIGASSRHRLYTLIAPGYRLGNMSGRRRQRDCYVAEVLGFGLLDDPRSEGLFEEELGIDSGGWRLCKPVLVG